MPSARSILKRLKKETGKLLPDEVEEILGQAKDYLSDPGRVVRDVAERAYTTPIMPGTSLKQTRERYDWLESKAVDPVREVVSLGIEEQLNPLAVAQRATSEPGGLEGLGRRFNERENTLQKRVIQAATDPLNLLPFGGIATGAARTGGRAVGQSLARAALREIAAPAAGQVAGHEIGRAVGGERGAQIGELAGLLGGGFGPNILQGRRVGEAGEQAARAVGAPVPVMGIVPPGGAAGDFGRTADTYLYHTTDRYAASDIAEQGLRPQRPSVRGEQEYWPKDMGGSGKEGRIYFATSEEIAQNFAEPNNVMLRVKRDAAERLGLLEEFANRDLFVRKRVKPQDIEAFVDGEWRPIRSLVEPNAPGAPALGIAPLGTTRAERPRDTIRLYHGTGSAFDAPEAGKFDPDGLFGPGYYLTSDARVAGSYGEARSADTSGASQVARENAEAIQRMLADEAEIERIAAFRRQTPEQTRAYLQEGMRKALAQLRGPNIRPVDVPRGLRLLDVDAAIAPREVDRVLRALNLPDVDRHLLDRMRAAGTPITGQRLWDQLSGSLTGGGSAQGANDLLARVGYDGIRYNGGQRIPLKDDAGKAIDHDAYVIFPGSLPKITNAISGTPGGLLPAESAADLARLRGQGAITPQLRPQERLSDAEIQEMLTRFKAEPRQKVTDALELNWQGALKDLFGTAVAPKTFADWRRVLTSGGAAQGAAANVVWGALQGETDPDQILQNALMGGTLGVGARRARLLGNATGMPGAKGPVLGAVGDLPPGAGHTAGRPLRIAAEIGDEAFGASRGVRPAEVEAAKAAAAAKQNWARDALAQMGIPEPPRGTAAVRPSRGSGAPRVSAAQGAKARAAGRAAHTADLKKTGASIIDLPRQVLVAGDIGQPLRIGVGGELAAISAGKGLQGLSAFGRALRAAINPTYFDEFMKRPENARWKGSTLLKDFDQNQENLSIIQRIPVIGAVEQALFQRFTPAYAVGVANAMSDGMKNAGDFKHMSAAQRNAVVGDWVKGLLIGRTKTDPEVGAITRAVSRFALAPRWTAGGITAVTKLADPGPQGELARRFWATAALMGVATSVSAWTVFGGKNPADLLNPTHPDSVVDPRNGRRFLTLPGPGGATISPLQPILPLARALLRPLVEGADTYAETQSLSEAVTAALGEGTDAGRDYFMGKAAPLVRFGHDVILNQDWQGRPVVTVDRETNPLGWAGQAALYLATQNIPIFLQPIAEPLSGRIGIPGGTLERDLRLPGAEPSMQDRLMELGLGFIGVQTRTPDRLPPAASAAFRAALESQGVQPGADGDLTRQYSALDLDPSEKASIERANPAIKEFFSARRHLEGEKYEKPAGRAQVNEYFAKKARLDETRRQALIELEHEQLPGDEYRRRRSLIFDRHRGMVDGLQEAVFDTSDPTRIDAAMEAVFRKHGPQSAEEKALDGLYAIRQEGDSIEARDAYFVARDAYLAGLPAAIRATIDQAQIDRAPTATERQYILAQREMQEYYAMPTYLGMTVEQSREANQIIARAKDRQVYEPWMKLKTLILLDETVADDDRVNAYMALGGKLSNPERRLWFQSRRHLAKFYSSLLAEEAALLAA